jgi:hypothetical protein
VAPWSVDALVADIGFFGQTGRWLWATAGICLLAELILSAKTGGVFELAPGRGQALPPVRALYHLRNAVFHPAHHSNTAGSGDAQISQLIVHLDGNGEAALAQRLDQNAAYLAQRPMTEFAVRMLDAAGRTHPDTSGVVKSVR